MRKYYFAFVVITLLIIGGVLSYTVGADTLQALSQVKVQYLLLALALSIMTVVVDSWRVSLLAAALGKAMPFRFVFTSMLGYNFLANLTPTASGGEPLLIYSLKKGGLSTGRATLLSLIRGFFSVGFIALAGPLVLPFYKDVIGTDMPNLVLQYAVGLSLFIALILACGFLMPAKVMALLEWLSRLPGKLGLISHDRVIWLEHKLDVWSHDFRTGWNVFYHDNPGVALQVGLLSVLYFFTYFMIAYVLTLGLNLDISLRVCLLLQVILFFLLYFTPTPGGSGVAEGAFYLLFSNFVPGYLLGVLTVLWRFFAAYLLVIIGAVAVGRTIGFGTLNEIELEEQEQARIKP